MKNIDLEFSKNNLVCPHWGEEVGLHQGKVEIFNRVEDGETGQHFTVENDSVTLDNNLEGNPSVRRHGLKIIFDCEHCNRKHVLCVYQHKGSTIMEWQKE